MMNEKKVPQLRFSGFDDEWEEKKLGDVSDRVTRKNENLESKLPLTISAQYGLVDQITFFNNQVASVANLKNYFLLKKGEFAYNKSYSAGYPWGAIKRLDRYDKGVLSTLYIVFKPKKINSDYLVSYYDTTNWHKQVSEIAAEGARNHGLLNIAPNDFFQTTLYAPRSENEQQKIGTMLLKIDSLIQAKTQKLESLKSVKKSLLQKCFPKDGEKVPQMRFEGFSGDWKEVRLGDLGTLKNGMNFSKDAMDKGFPFINLQNVFGNNIVNLTNLGKAEATKGQLTDYCLNKGDVLFVRSSVKLEGVGEAAVIPTNLDNTTYSGFIIRFRDNFGLDINFKRFIFTTPSVRYQIITQATDSANKNISQIVLSNLIFKIPSITEQQKIGQFFSKYDSLISLQQKEIDNLKTIKKSLLQKMFV